MKMPCPVVQFAVRGLPVVPYNHLSGLVIVGQGEDGHSSHYGERLKHCWQDWPNLYGLVTLEHDIAVPLEAWQELADAIEAHPHEVTAVPYRLYRRSTGLHHGIWAHRILLSGSDRDFATGAVPPETPIVAFALGCTFLPRRLLDALPADLRQWDYPVLDTRLSELAHKLGVAMRTTATPAVHLHY